MRIVLTLIFFVLGVNCALSVFKRKLKSFEEENKKIKTYSEGNQKQASNRKISKVIETDIHNKEMDTVCKTADVLYKEAKDLWKDMTEQYSKPYDNQFNNVKKLSMELIRDYESISKMDLLRLLDEEILEIFKFFKEGSKINYTTVSSKINFKTNLLSDTEKQHTYILIYIEFMKLQKYYYIIPELIILDFIRTTQRLSFSQLFRLRIINLFLEKYVLNYSSALKYKENIMSFIEDLYKYTVDPTWDLKKQLSLKLEVDGCKKEHFELLGIFIGNLASKQRSVMKLDKSLKYNIFKQTTRRSQYFLITSYSLLYRHLMLNVIVQNKNYDLKAIYDFMKKYSIENPCIGCMLNDCFNILKSPI